MRVLRTTPAPRWVATLPWALSLSAHAAVLAAAVALHLDAAPSVRAAGAGSGITVLALPSDHPRGPAVTVQSGVSAPHVAVAQRAPLVQAELRPEEARVPLEVPAQSAALTGAHATAAEPAAPAQPVDRAPAGTEPRVGAVLAELSTAGSDASLHDGPPSGPADTAPPHRTETLQAVGYLDTPAPPYPETARRAGREGLVRIRARIDSAGLPGELKILQTSGWDELDAAALAGVARWRFAPARRGEQPVGAWMDIPVRFSLHGDR